jgi:hypothetical protein
VSGALAAHAMIEGRYELLERMEDRGLGESWQARDTRFKSRLVMLKFLRRTGGEALPEALQDHVNALRALKHASVLAVVGHGVWQGRPFLVHEHFEGRSLGDGIDRSRTSGELLPAKVIEALFARVLAAVAAAHDAPQPLYHGALNPGCVALHRLPGEDFQLRVFDLGLAAFADPDPSAPERSARALLALAPEQFQAGRRADATVDVFGLGALLREMISLPPELGGTLAPTSLHRRREDLPAALWDVAGVAMNTVPAQRFQSVEDFSAALQRAWRVPVPARPAKPAPAAARTPEAGPSLTPGPRAAPPAPPAAPAAFEVGPVYKLPPLPAPPRGSSLKAQDYASTFVLSDLPSHSNPWDVAFLSGELAAPQAVHNSMDALLHAVQQRADKPPTLPPGRFVAQAPRPIAGTLVLGEGAELSDTVVNRAEGATPGGTLCIEHVDTAAQAPIGGTLVLPGGVAAALAEAPNDTFVREEPRGGPPVRTVAADPDLAATTEQREKTPQIARIAPTPPVAPPAWVQPPVAPPAWVQPPVAPPAWVQPPVRAPRYDVPATTQATSPERASRAMLLLAVAGFVGLATLSALAFVLLTQGPR